jgi:hypothetical protein
MKRKRLIVLVLLVVVIAACAKKAKSQCQSEWRGLTESEARSKLDAKLPDKIPAEKRSAISDKVVAKMRDRGVISEDPAVPNDVSGVADDADQLATH